MATSSIIHLDIKACFFRNEYIPILSGAVAVSHTPNTEHEICYPQLKL